MSIEQQANQSNFNQIKNLACGARQTEKQV